MIVANYTIPKEHANDYGMIDVIRSAQKLAAKMQSCYAGHIGVEEEFDVQITLKKDGSVEVNIAYEG